MKYTEEKAQEILSAGWVVPATIRSWRHRGIIPSRYEGELVEARVIFDRLPERTKAYYRKHLPEELLTAWLRKPVNVNTSPEVLRQRIVMIKKAYVDKLGKSAAAAL